MHRAVFKECSMQHSIQNLTSLQLVYTVLCFFTLLLFKRKEHNERNLIDKQCDQMKSYQINEIIRSNINTSEEQLIESENTTL